MENTTPTDTFFTRRLAAKGQPLIIAGPCSAESEEQVLTVARALKAAGQADMYRAGIWKPRTKPGGFEGRGAAALPWLQAARAETGLPMAIEVATPKHVEEALKHGIDVLWIGARTTVNPFAVQELADALAGTGVPAQHAGTLPEAVAAAARLARPVDAVLLSPACASFDMFRGYDHRAEVFCEAVHELAEPHIASIHERDAA